MKPQLSQDYNVDARYKGGKGSVDNAAGKAFVNNYLKRREQSQQPQITEDRQQDNRIVMSGPGDSTYSFKNGFRASK